MNMFPSTYYTFPQEIIENLHYSRRLLLHSPFQHSQQPSPPPTTPQVIIDPAGSSHANNNGFDTNIIMILAGLLCALICSLCINTLIRCVLKCSSLIRGEPIYYLNMINHEKKKPRGLDKRALKTFPVVKYSNDVKIKGLSNECVICISEFKGGEKVRIMPICNHGFHVKCIDKWLSSHSSCPTCRQSLVDTCKKIIRCCDDHQEISPSSLALPSSSSTSTSSREVIVVSIVPLEREDLVRNYRGEVAEC